MSLSLKLTIVSPHIHMSVHLHTRIYTHKDWMRHEISRCKQTQRTHTCTSMHLHIQKDLTTHTVRDIWYLIYRNCILAIQILIFTFHFPVRCQGSILGDERQKTWSPIFTREEINIYALQLACAEDCAMMICMNGVKRDQPQLCEEDSAEARGRKKTKTY